MLRGDILALHRGYLQSRQCSPIYHHVCLCGLIVPGQSACPRWRHHLLFRHPSLLPEPLNPRFLRSPRHQLQHNVRSCGFPGCGSGYIPAWNIGGAPEGINWGNSPQKGRSQEDRLLGHQGYHGIHFAVQQLQTRTIRLQTRTIRLQPIQKTVEQLQQPGHEIVGGAIAQQMIRSNNSSISIPNP